MDKSELEPFIKLAMKVETTDEFIEKARQINNVSQAVQDWFADNYRVGTMLSIEKASEDFMEDVDSGKFSKIVN